MNLDIVTFMGKSTRLLATTNGRDKVMKFIDYSVRAVNYYIDKYDKTNASKQLFAALESHIITSRKLFFMGRWIEFLNLLITKDLINKDPISRLLLSGRSLCYALWIAFDNLNYLTRIGVLNQTKAKEYARKAATFWLVGLLFAISSHIKDINKIVREGKEKKQNLKQIISTHPNTFLNLLKDVADLSIPIVILEKQPFQQLFVPNKGVLCIYGLLSSSIFIYQLWE